MTETQQILEAVKALTPPQLDRAAIRIKKLCANGTAQLFAFENPPAFWVIYAESEGGTQQFFIAEGAHGAIGDNDNSAIGLREGVMFKMPARDRAITALVPTGGTNLYVHVWAMGADADLFAAMIK